MRYAIVLVGALAIVGAAGTADAQSIAGVVRDESPTRPASTAW
jgi:hypothetical protein